MPTNLPYHLTTFIGREEDLTHVRRLLTNRRLVTLTGPGGVGKTRLAQQVATSLEETFSDGIWLIELANLTDPSLILQFLLGACNIREQAGRTPWEILLEQWKSRHLLLILDNCEHLLASCAELAARLLRQCAQVTLLITSREQLHITGEAVWALTGLTVPSLEDELPPAEQLMQYDAIQFFADRALTTAPRFLLTEQNARAVVQICAHLDGLPLAVELAVARLPMLSAEQIARRLHERFRLLTRGDRVADPRLQTLQATLDWSYDLLSSREQMLFCRLSIFAGSWTLEAMEGICSDTATASYDLLNILTHLVNKSLVVAETFDDVVRYRLLETMQQYARMHQRALGNDEPFIERHWNWYLHMAEEAAAHIHGDQQQFWFAHLESDGDNLRLALERSLNAGQIEITARIACALGHFWTTRSRLNEGHYWYEMSLKHPELSRETRIAVLHHMAEILRFQGDYARVRTLLKERLAFLQEGQSEVAEIADTLSSLGWAAFYIGEFAEAIRSCNEGLHLFQQIDNQQGIATCLSGLIMVATLQQEYRQALTLLETVLDIRRQQQDQATLAYTLNAQARVAALYGEDELACRACREALELTARLRQPFGTAYGLEAAATIAYMRGDVGSATQLFSASQVLRERIGVPLPPSIYTMREQEYRLLRVKLGKNIFTSQWKQGLTLEPAEARALAMHVLANHAPVSPAPTGYPAGLSQREVDVLCLVSTGYTDAQVAHELVLSPRTVSTHLRSIYRKLGVNSRTAATRWAQEHHLL